MSAHALALGLALSLLVGASLGVLGGGGSILMVPILHYVFGLDAKAATGASLAVVGVTAAFAALRYARRGEVAWRAGLAYALPSFAGIFLTRRWVVPWVPERISLGVREVTGDQIVLGVFAAVMLAAGLAMWRRARAGSGSTLASTSTPARASTLREPRLAPVVAQGFVVGGLTGFVGAGGGFLIVPALSLLGGLEMRRAVGTSLLIIALNALVGMGGDLLAGASLPWPLVGGALSASLAGMAVGTRLASRVPAEALARAFAVFVVVMGVLILTKEFLWT